MTKFMERLKEIEARRAERYVQRWHCRLTTAHL